MQKSYPLWKRILLIISLVIACIYAAPNLFGDDPSVQISSLSSVVINDSILGRVQNLLDKKQLKYVSIENQTDKILVRFVDTDIQLKARDLLKSELGSDYLVALNLASRTPKFLQKLGAYPMKLGLDLRGGVHFLLEVDINKMIKAREEGDIKSIVTHLREANLRYLSLERVQPNGLIISFRDKNHLDKGYAELSKYFQDYEFKTVAQDGIYTLQMVMSEKAIFKVADYAIDQTMNILRNRVNELGLSEALVQRQGANHVSVDFPGIQDTVRAKEIIGKTATLRFQMVDIEHDPRSGDIPLGSKRYDYEGRSVFLKDQIILQGNSITYATPSYSQDGRPSVSVRLGGGGESMFHRVTAENVGKPMAVVYVETKTEKKNVNGKIETVSYQEEKIISVATIQSALGNNFEISGLRTEKYAQDLSLLLRSGALVAPVNIVQELTVGPNMGKANIQKGVVSILVGFAFVVVFMALYYRVFGLITDIALLLNLIFIVAILSILGATLTLPGMAGIVLTVGMAVDANVLIYERIREELRNGMTPYASIRAGYEHAFVTIVDANVATLIVASVLFALGSGAVKGFAIVLIIGIMTSMLTAIVFTRALVNLIYKRTNVKRLSIGM